MNSKNILWFKEISREDIPLVGGKGANLGEMARIGLPVPNGFVVTVKAYFDFIKVNHLENKIRRLLKGLDTESTKNLRLASEKIKKLISTSPIPPEIAADIAKAYLKLSGRFKQSLVAIRSSATAEDLPNASFAGQQATFLNIQGEASVVDCVRGCWASLFEPRAIFYRQEQKFDHFKVGIAVPIQEMVQSRVSGVMFTIDPVTNEKNRIVIEAIYGLGEMIVQGEVIPDHYVVDATSLKILSRQTSPQKIQLIKTPDGTTKRTSVPGSFRKKPKITPKQIQALAKLGRTLHKHYYFPQDIEWAETKKGLFILQTRPITTITEQIDRQSWSEIINKKPILIGEPASPGLAVGKVKIIKSEKEIAKINKGDILVASMTKPDYVPAMKKAVAIVTDLGGQTSHAAIVSRELGVPCVVGTKKATKVLKTGQLITVHGTNGEIYSGGLDSQKIHLKLGGNKKSVHSDPIAIKTATRIYANIAEPEIAAALAQKNIDGIGLLRAEFMVAEIGIHPRKLIEDKKQKVFIDKLSEGIGTICRALNPRPVVYRTTDFKTNEYRNLKGGDKYEKAEENPLIGFRGAGRYIADDEVFEMELAAIKKVRNQQGLKNLWLMIPFVRTPAELQKVKQIVAANGLTRSPSFKIWLMVEIPANVIILEEFIKVGIDGVSIGSNDLTMLTLGIDRDNEMLAESFDERNPAVLWCLEKTIKTCQKNGLTSSICGQAPSLYPDLVEKLVEWGITSVSIAPDKIDQTKQLVYEAEKKLIQKKSRKK